jgi:SnoaL-like domain
VPGIVDPGGKPTGDEPVGRALNPLPGDHVQCGHRGHRARLGRHLPQAADLRVRETRPGRDRLADLVERAVQRRDLDDEGEDVLVHLVAHLGILAGANVDNVLSNADDVLAIHELLALHGHLVDGRELDRLDELFTAHAVYDVRALGQGEIHGLEQFREVSLAFADDERNPVGHHVTNVIVEELTGDTAVVRSKGLGVLRDGRTGSVTYLDRLVRTPQGWRIAARRVVPRPS